MSNRTSRSNSPMRSSLEDLSRRNPRRSVSTKQAYQDDGVSIDLDAEDYDDVADEDEEMEVDEVEPLPSRVTKRGRSSNEPAAAGRRSSSRSNRYKASLKEPPSDSIRDLFAAAGTTTPKKKMPAKAVKSPAATHKAVRRKVMMEAQVSSEEEFSDEEESEEGEPEDQLKIQRILAARSEKRSKWKEICSNMNSSEVDNGSRWNQDENEKITDSFEERFLVKWDDLSYLHCTWETQDDMVDQLDNAKSYLRTFFRKSIEGYLFTPDERCDGDYFDPSFTQVERILEVSACEKGKDEKFGLIMDRNHPNYEDGTGRQFLIKWGSTPYDESTYEFERDLIMNDIEYEPQLEDFFKRSKKPTKSAIKSFFAEGEREMRRLYKFFGSNNKMSDENRNAEIAAYQKVLAEEIYPNGGQLRDYQAEGVSWMMANYVNDRSSLLADEMGLGKTLQTCSFINLLASKLNKRGPFLVVAPLSTLEHWKREFQTWTSLNTIVYHGSAKNREQTRELEFAYSEDRPPQGGVAFNSSFLRKCHNKKKSKLEKLWMAQVVITTPEMLTTDDYTELTAVEWDALVVDEAHRLKSHSSKLATNLRDERFHFGHTLLLTGTPIQNNMSELWSLLSVIDPERFDNLDKFLESYGDMKSKEGIDELHENIRPYILRRLKEDVEKSVPPKEETLIEVELTSLQKQYYRALYEKNVQFLHKNKKKALDGPSLNNLAMQLRKCCNHPFLLRGVEDDVRAAEQKSSKEFSESDFLAKYSGKLILLDKLLPRLKNDGHRVLIFSQFKIMLDILDDYLRERDFKAERIDGSITGKKRQMAIDRFQTPSTTGKEAPFIMMLSTKAGGVGINLTAADTCIIFDSDWNPQNDLQAQARCHRIGQTKSVKVYRLLTRKTYEMQMFHMSSLKMGLDQAVLQGFEGGSATGGEGALSKEEVEKLLRHGAYDIFNEEKSGMADAESNAFIEQDIDSILERRAKTVVHENTGSKSSAAGGTFSKASFKAASTPSKNGVAEAMDVDVDDPDFWTKMVGEAKVDESDDVSGQKRKRRIANYSERAYAKQLENQLKEGYQESDSSRSDDEINENDFASDDESEGSSPSNKRRKKEFSKWGRKGSMGWKRRDVDKLSKALQTFGYGLMSWEEFRTKCGLSGYDCSEIQRMSWSLVLVTLSECAKESVIAAQRKEVKALQRKRMRDAEEGKEEEVPDESDVVGGVLAMQHNGEESKKARESHFQSILSEHKAWLAHVFQDSKAYAQSNGRRPTEASDRYLPTTPSKSKQTMPGQENAVFAQNLWPQLKNRGWKVEQENDQGDTTTRYMYDDSVYKSPASVMAVLPKIHPELIAIVEEVQHCLDAIKRKDEEENSYQLSMLDPDTITMESLERHIGHYAPLQLVVDRMTTKRLNYTRKLLTTCSALFYAHDIVNQAKESSSHSSIIEAISFSLTTDKRKLLPQPGWTSKHDAVLIVAIEKHGWVEHDACCRAITEDKSIRWGPPFDFADPSTESVKSPEVDLKPLIRVGKRVANFFNTERECLDSLKDISEATLARAYGLRKSAVTEENSTALWEVDESLLRDVYIHEVTEGETGTIDLPTKKDLVRRAKTLLSKQITLVLKATEKESAVEQTHNHGFSVLDQKDASNLFLAELIRSLIKLSFNSSGKRRILGKRLMNTAIKEARSRAQDLEVLFPDNPEAIASMKKIGEHCAHSHRYVQSHPVQSKNVLRAVLGTQLLTKPGTNPFPTSRTFAIENLAERKSGGEQSKEKKVRQRRKRHKGASGDVAISDAMLKVAQDKETVRNLISDGAHLQLSAPETLLLTVVCSQGLPVWTKDWYDMIDPSNIVAEKQGPGFQHAISWWGMGTVFEAAANVWHRTALLKLECHRVDYESQFSDLPDSDIEKQEAKRKIEALVVDEGRKRLSLAIAGDYKEHPEKLAKKCVMLLESLRNHMGTILTKKPSNTTAKVSKSENGLGPFVMEWLSEENRRWAESLDIVDGAGKPLSFTAADFPPSDSNVDNLHSIAALIDKKGCRTVFSQVAQQSRVREVFIKHPENDVKSLLQIAVISFANVNEWEGKPEWWGLETQEQESTSYSIQHDYFILDSLLEFGYSGIEETLSQFNEEKGLEDSEHKLTRSDIQFRANQLARGLHSLERNNRAKLEVLKLVGQVTNVKPRGIDSYFNGEQTDCIQMICPGPSVAATSITDSGPERSAISIQIPDRGSAIDLTSP